MLWLTLLQHRYIHIFTCSQIQWFTDSFRFQNRRGKQSIRRHIRCYFSISNHNNTIYIPIKHIFQTMLNNHNCCMIIFLNPVNQINGSFSTGRIQIRQRLIKQQDLYPVNHDPCHRHSLLLPSGKFSRCMIQQIFQIQFLRSLFHTLMHFFL